ncbi:MAG: leucine-rich repeat protein [Clostridiales bacterium]|nr:leucine-rich repeat protein [Clostridiales bacterium]
MKGKRWLHAVVVSIVAVFGALAIACGGDDDGKKDNKPFTSPAIGVYYYDAGTTEYLLSLNADKTLALTIDNAAISGKYDVSDSGAVTFSVSGADKLLNTAKYENDEVTLTYDGNVYKFLRNVNYTVTFNTGSGSKIDSATVRNGKKVTKPADPEYANHVFIGWYKDANATNAFKFATDVVRGDLTLYAGWVDKTERDEYQVKFDLGYGDNSLYYTAKTVNGKVYPTEMADPARANYTFKGWWLKDAASGEYATRVDLGSYVFAQNETVYALWQGAAEGGKLDAPIVSVDLAGNRLSWDSVKDASSYSVKVVDPEGKEWERTVSGTSVEYADKFTKAGTYTVEVYAVSLASADKNSAVTTRKIVNKQLARVSNFKVTGDVLTFGGVENATKYLLYITCDDETHDHNPIDNGSSKEYNFGDCAMPDSGIKFVVEAQADGYVSSRSEEYVVARKLDEVTGFKYDENTQTVSWSAVPNAASYLVSVKCDDPTHEVETEVRNATEIFIGGCAAGSVKVTVVAKNAKKYIPSDSALYAVNKTELAAVTGLELIDTTLTWKKQSRVKKYIVDVNGVTNEVEGDNSVDLSKLANLTWEVGKVYDIKVRAELTGGELTSWSLPFSAAYKTMSELKYSEGVVSWSPVFGIGTAGYKVVVNDAAPVSVSTASYKVTLTDKTNVIKVYIGNADASTAKSISVNAYKLTLDGNGGTDANVRYYAKGDPIALPTSSEVTRRGYNLMGWYTAAEGTGAAYYDGDLYDLDADLKLFARWDGKEYTVKLNYNINCDDTDEVVTTKVKFGSEYSLGVPTTPKSLMHGFLQWNLAADGKGAAVSDLYGDGMDVWNIADDNVTLYAVWAELFEFEKEGEGNDAYYVVRQGEGTPLVNEVVIPAQYQAQDDTRMYPVKIIGGNAFNKCHDLTKVTIPASIETIEETAFNNCAALEQINVDGARPGIDNFWSVDGVLYGINKISEKIELKLFPRGRSGDFTLADGIEELSYHSMYNANINTLTLPSTLKRVASGAFEYSSITEVIFAEPKNANENVEPLTISSNAFRFALSLTSVTLPSREVTFGDGKNIDFKADFFRSCSALESVYVAPNNSKYMSIDGMLCEIDPATKEITLVFCPANYQFGNNGLYKTDNRLTAIGDKAFSGVSGLRAVEIDVSISRIGKNAFSGYTTKIDEADVNVSGCSSLTNLTVFGGRVTPLVIGESAFGSDNSSRASVSLNFVDFQDGCNVTEIQKYAFAYCRILRVTFPNSLAKLGDGVFKDCRQLGTVTFGVSDEGGFEFGEDVFMNCVSLRRVILPKNITSFEGGVFAGCENLETIEVDPENPVLEFVDGILYGKKDGKITAIHFVPVGVDLTDFKLPDGITEISAGVFGNAGGSIKKLTINKYVTNIGLAAFAGTGIEEVIFENKENDEDDGADTLSIAAPAVSTSYNKQGLFAECTKLERVVLPKRLKAIPNYMFAKCDSLTSIDLGGVTEIGAWAFYYSGLSDELVIPRTVEKINPYAFSNCSKLTKVTFEDERTKDLVMLNTKGEKDGLNNEKSFVTRVTNGNYFANCSNLTEVHFPEKLLNIGEQTFYYCSALTTVNIPASVESIRASAFFINISSKLTNINFAPRPNSNALYLEEGFTTGYGSDVKYYGIFCSLPVKDVVLPSGTVRIPSYCFYKCSSLETLYIPNTVNNTVNEQGKAVVFGIGNSVLQNCSNVTSITFEADNPADLANANHPGLSVPSNFIYYCSKLTSITLPARLADYYSYAGATEKTAVTGNLSSTSLTNINVMPGGRDYSSVDGIMYNAAGTEIRYCPRGRVDAVTIPYSVSKIGVSAFKDCKKLTGVTFAGKPAAAEGETVANNDLVIDEEAFYSCAITEINIPARTTRIGKNAFCNSDVEVLTFENNSKLITIEEQAFYGTELSGTITIPASVTTIGVKAFTASSGLTNVTAVKFGAAGETSKLTNIGANAFEKIGITEVYIPDSVTTLGNQVFANCLSLTTASLPLTVDNFNGTFLNCGNLTSLTFREVAGKAPVLNKTDDGAVYSNDNSVLYYYPQDGVPGKGTANEGVLTIQSGVTEIAPTAFAFNPNIKKVVIPNTVTKIGEKAFYFMSALEEVEFEADNDTTKATTLVIEGERAFAGCSRLTTVRLPARLQTIAKEAFYYCTSLSDLTFAEGCKLTTINEGAFKYTGNLGNVTLPANVSSIGKEAFRYSGIGGVEIPAAYKHSTSNTHIFADCANLTKVEFKTPASNRSSFQTVNYMFYNCPELSDVTLPDDLTKIGTYTFQLDENLTSIKFNNSKGLLTTIDSYAFSKSGIEEITLPANFTTINEGAFSECTALVGINRGTNEPAGTVNLPSKVKTIGAKAFYKCSNVTNIKLTDITVALTIGNQAFAATGIKEITIPAKVTTLNKIFSTPGTSDATDVCKNLETVTFASGNTGLKSIPDSLFMMLPKLKTVVLPKGLSGTGTNVLSIGSSAFYGTAIEEIEIPKETKEIKSSAFRNCANLKSITFEKKADGTCALQTIAGHAFAGSGLTTISIPKSVKLSASNMFEGCTSLTSVVFESGNTNVTGGSNSHLFRDCTALKSVTLPSGLSSIDSYMFYGCTALESIEIPSNVTKIDVYAFSGCTKLGNVTLGNSVDQIGNYAFQNSGLTSIEIPASVNAIGNYAFGGCAKLETVTYGAYSGLRTIGNYAFNGCTKLLAINIPEGVTTIGDSAYENCDAVTTVTLPNSLRTLGNNPFINCDLLAEIVAPTYEEGETVRFTTDNSALYNGDKSILYAFYDRNAASFTLLEETVEIASNAFWNMPLTTVVANTRVVEEGDGLLIGNSAFRYSGISSITLGNNVYINSYAFANCGNLTSISIPDGANLEKLAFDGSANLANITFEGDVTYSGHAATFGENAVVTLTGVAVAGVEGLVIKSNAYQNDTALVNVVIAEGVTVIQDNAFLGASNLTNVTLPSTLKTISTGAFRGTKLASLTLPASVETIGNDAFVSSENNITSLTLPSGLKSIGSGAFAGLKMSSITIPNTVENISADVFLCTLLGQTYVCENLSSIVFEAGNTKLTNIPQHAFRNLPALTSVTLPDHLESIGTNYTSGTGWTSSSFIGTSLTSISIPSTVTVIAAYAFDGVSTLKSVTFEKDSDGNSSLTTIYGSAFRNSGLTGELKIPASVTVIEDSAFYGCDGISSITFECDAQGASSLSSISKGAFYGTAITTVTIPASVKLIGAINTSSALGTFEACTQLATVNFAYDAQGKSALESIGSNVFKNSGLTQIVIPETVTRVDAAFAGCASLRKVTLPKDIYYFGTGMFANLTSLEEVVIPEGVTSLAANSFEGCTGIKKLVLPSTITGVKSLAFKDWTNTQTICLTGIVAPRSGFDLDWAAGCNANLVWNYQPQTESVNG